MAKAKRSRRHTKPHKTARRWSQRVTKESNALDLERGVFAQSDPRKIALSLRRSAEKSTRRKVDAFRSAMSMLNFYINRAGRNLPKQRKATLQRAKDELRSLYGKAA
jgi:membrane-bound lytic murein transglycosylase B